MTQPYDPDLLPFPSDPGSPELLPEPMPAPDLFPGDPLPSPDLYPEPGPNYDPDLFPNRG